MCTNYRPGSRDFLRERFGADPPFEYPAEAYPAAMVPIIRAVGATEVGKHVDCARASFGLIPHWATDAKIARSTYNARAETVAEKPSFRRAWRQAQFCLVPMVAFYEPNYDSGRPVRWRIERRDGREFAVAGIWEQWAAPGAQPMLSFSMLTVNADANALMRQFHAPGDEKRSLVVVDPGQYEGWLHADGTSARAMLGGLPAQEFVGQPDPRTGRRRSGATATGSLL